MLGITTLISIVGAYAIGRSRRREQVGAPADPELADRMARVERAVETMAVELERIGEGQRFLVRVMSDKLPSGDRPRSPGRVVTPH